MLKRLILTAFLIFIVFSCFSAIWQDGSLQINGIRFNLVPEVNYRTSTNLCEPLAFTSSVISYPDSCRLDFTSSMLDISIRIIPQPGYLAPAWKVIVNQTFTQDIIIRDIALRLIYEDSTAVERLQGTHAINTGNIADNENLYPFTGKFMEVRSATSACWIVGSGYSGCEGVEWMNADRIYYYDHNMHYAKLYNQPDIFARLIDIKPCHTGQMDTWSFLLFAEKPYLPDFSLFPAGKKAAFAISNDADGENSARLMSVYFGSNNPQSPDYLTKGLAANHIPVSNTVFGIDYDTLHTVWDDIQDSGSSIGFHTYSDFADSTAATANSLLGTMAEYHIRLWIDHSWGANPEDFAVQGGMTDSPFYILEIINQSNIDYAWLGETIPTNPINMFAEPWRLPHRLYYFQNLVKPVLFFGRTRMEAWEYLNSNYPMDFTHNVTAAKLDRLLDEKGVCIGYTHFSFSPSSIRLTFYDVLDSGEYVVRDDVNDAFIMLDDYQQNRGLWIDTVEHIFDRMLAVDKVMITNVAEAESPGFVRITIQNKSGTDIPELEYTYGVSTYSIPLLQAGASESFILNAGFPPDPDDKLLPFLVQFEDGNVFVHSRDLQTMPAVKVKIYNVKGQLVTKGDTDSEQYFLALPFGTKASGVYFAKVETEGQKAQYIKFTVLR
jgi:hypothetical protein